MQNVNKIISALTLAPVGFLIGGLFGWVGTIYAYGIGSMLTAPVGCAMGGYLGWKTPLRNSALVFVGCFGSIMVTAYILSESGMDSILKTILIALFGCIGSTLIYAPGINRIPFRSRRMLAITLNSIFLMYIIIKFLISIYSTDS